MTRNWYTCKVKYNKLSETGNNEKVTEPYLIEGISYTDAETRVYHLMEEMIRGDFQVLNITKTNITEIIHYDDAEVWYKAKLATIEFDEESGKEKKNNSYILVSAENVKDAFEKIQEAYGQTTFDYVIPSIAYTTIIEVFPYGEDENYQVPEHFAKAINKVDTQTGEIQPQNLEPNFESEEPEEMVEAQEVSEEAGTDEE